MYLHVEFLIIEQCYPSLRLLHTIFSSLGQPLPKQWYNRNNGRNKWHRFNGKSHVLHTTEHHLSTRIEDVGLQVIVMNT